MYRMIELPTSDNGFYATFVNISDRNDLQKLHRREYFGMIKVGDEVDLKQIKKF